jgi:mono/diheme cytochrome c family protein
MKNTHLRKFAVGASVVTLFAVLVLVSGSAKTEVKYVNAASYYKDAKCVVCHGPKAAKKFNTELKDEELVEIVLKGKKVAKPPHMPGYESKGVTAEQAKALIDYMKGLKAAP